MTGTKLRGHFHGAKLLVITTAISAFFWLGLGSILSKAAEDAKGLYLMGTRGPQGAIMPPPGTYLNSLKYYYSGEASGTAAESFALEQIGPINVTANLQADVTVDAEVYLELPNFLWVAPDKVLGGRLGLGTLIPIGWQELSVDIDAQATITLGGSGPLGGVTLQRGAELALNDDTVNFGDPVLQAILGWNRGNWHWNIAGLLNIPIGEFDKDNLVNMGLHRWALDTTGAVTWLDPNTGHEVSVVAGVTFNGENPDTSYRTGTEFHVEYALKQHFSKTFALGLVGFHYEQLTGDSGPGATLGSFKGRSTGIGPVVKYDFQLGQLPVSTQLRWYNEMNVKNRLEGNLVYLQATIPLGGPRN